MNDNRTTGRWAVVFFTALAAASAARLPAAETDDGFRPIFDGKTLQGWESPDMSYWSVANGAITGRITAEHPLKVNQYLVWREPMGDFELKMRFRMFGSKSVNGGFQFRSRLLPGHDMAGYQMDNNLDTPWLARLYEEHGRHTLAFRGKRALVDAQGQITSSDIPGAGGPPWFQLETWHEYHLICQGPRLILYVNGRLAAEAIDGDTAHRALSGLLGLQLHSGPPTTAQFADILLRTLAPGAAISRPTPPARSARQTMLRDKTLVAWVSLANLTQRGGSALSIDDQASHFDGIVFGERAEGKWMAGSNFFARTQKNQRDCPPETADAHALVQMAIAYQGCDVTIWRNAKIYARYQIPEPQEFGPESAIVIGLRHLQAGDGKCFAGTIDDARVYAVALSGQQLAALRPGKPSEPRPLAWLVFQDGKAVERMGAFPLVELMGDARVVGSRLHLSGNGAYLVATGDEAGNYASPVHYRPRRGVFADPIPFFWKGDYHVFYLRGGVGPVPWEHIVSRDLVHWKELPTALKVDGAADGPDGGAMFTGSVVEGLGQFHIFYTGHNGRNPQGTEVLMHATSPDLLRWTKHPDEVLTPDGVIYKNSRERDFRDPYVFWNEPEQCFWMVFFGNDARSGRGVQGLAVSKDLKHWQFQPPLAGAGGQECPDLFQIGDKWYLLGGDHYTVARQPRGPYAAPPVCEQIDRPFVYAAKRMFDGTRHVWSGWLWDRSPRSDTGRGCWGGTQCLPRELYAGPGGQLYCRPVAEATAAFAKTVLDLAEKPTNVKPGVCWAVPDHYMLQCRLRIDPKAEVTLTMRQTAEPGSGYRLILRPAKQQAEIASPVFSHARRIELDAARPVTIQAFVLGSMIETFVNDQYALSCRAYDDPTGKLALGTSGGGATLLELKIKVPQ